jgi:hypothetical protein
MKKSPQEREINHNDALLSLQEKQSILIGNTLTLSSSKEISEDEAERGKRNYHRAIPPDGGCQVRYYKLFGFHLIEHIL